jgi:hypothetical protein
MRRSGTNSAMHSSLTVSRIAGNPLLFAERGPGVRQAQLRGEGVEVVAVSHGHRERAPLRIE